jgi:hypothetical protein
MFKAGHFRSNFNQQSQVVLAAGLAQRLNPDVGSIGMHALGIGYHMPEFHIVDFLGKAEPYIARSTAHPGRIGHNKWDYDYAFSNYDIAAVSMPISMPISMVKRVRAPNYQPRKTGDQFWDIAILKMLSSGDYRFCCRPSWISTKIYHLVFL